MANSTISMSKIRQILRMQSQGRSILSTAAQTDASRNTVKRYLNAFKESGFTFAEVDALNDKELEDFFYFVFFFRGNVVLFCELGARALRGCGGGACGCSAPLGRLWEDVSRGPFGLTEDGYDGYVPWLWPKRGLRSLWRGLVLVEMRLEIAIAKVGGAEVRIG